MTILYAPKFDWLSPRGRAALPWELAQRGRVHIWRFANVNANTNPRFALIRSLWAFNFRILCESRRASPTNPPGFLLRGLA